MLGGGIGRLWHLLNDLSVVLNDGLHVVFLAMATVDAVLVFCTLGIDLRLLLDIFVDINEQLLLFRRLLWRLADAEPHRIMMGTP